MVATSQAVQETSETPLAVQRVAPSPQKVELEAAWEEAMWLPCQLTVELLVPAFTVGDLLRMDVETIVDCQWRQNADVPLRVNGLVIGFAEFEVIGEKSA